jgi:20S proteasome alpha/beta subunit
VCPPDCKAPRFEGPSPFLRHFLRHFVALAALPTERSRPYDGRVTLSVAVSYPWVAPDKVYLAEQIMRIGGWATGVVVATDCRFLYPDGHSDDGRKIHRLADNAVMAFAGEVQSAERAAASISKMLRRRRDTVTGRPATQDTSRAAALHFRAAHQAEVLRAKQQHRKPRSLDALVAFCNDDGSRGITRYSSQRGFAPEFHPMAAGIGDERAFKRFQKHFEEAAAQAWSKEELPSQPRHWQIQIIHALKMTIDEDPNKTLGGAAQTVMVTPQGIIGQRWVVAEALPDGELRWSEPSIFPTEAKPLDNARRAASQHTGGTDGRADASDRLWPPWAAASIARKASTERGAISPRYDGTGESRKPPVIRPI